VRDMQWIMSPRQCDGKYMTRECMTREAFVSELAGKGTRVCRPRLRAIRKNESLNH